MESEQRKWGLQRNGQVDGHPAISSCGILPFRLRTAPRQEHEACKRRSRSLIPNPYIPNPNPLMPGFKTHITGSSLLGVGYGGAAYFMYGVPWPTCALAGGLCSVSGMLPDIDSDSSTPQRESMAFAAAVVPMMLLHRFQHWGMSHEMILLAGAAVYLLIRFGAAALLRLYTVHRGMFHSLPAAVVFGEIAFLLASGDDLYCESTQPAPWRSAISRIWCWTKSRASSGVTGCG